MSTIKFANVDTPTQTIALVDGATGLPVGSSTSPLPIEQAVYTYSRKTADAQVKAGSGYLHNITISPTGSVTAGVLTIYDSLTETGTIIASISLPVTTFTPFSISLDVTFATGLFCGFDATLANVQATFSYR